MADPFLGQAVWYELLTNDVKGAERFYTTVVGWTVSPFDPAAPDTYDIWRRDGEKGVGGVARIPEGMNYPPHWGMYLATPTLNETVAAIERRGGSAVTPVIDIPKVGPMRTMRDPQGAVFSLLQPSTPGTPADVEPQVGEVAWHELHTTDAEAALKFYTELFGWQPIEPFDMGKMGKYYLFRRGAAFAGGMMNKPPEMAQVPTHWGLYFRVPNVHEAVERAKANGGKVLSGPMEVPGGDWAAICMDPQGAAFSLYHKT